MDPTPHAADQYGSQNWGDTADDFITAAGGLPDYSGKFPQLVSVEDVAQIWSVRMSIQMIQAQLVGDTSIAEFFITAGIGRASFSQTVFIPLIGAVQAGFEVISIIPVLPARSITIKARNGFTSPVVGHTSHVRLNVGAAPYYPGPR